MASAIVRGQNFFLGVVEALPASQEIAAEDIRHTHLVLDHFVRLLGPSRIQESLASLAAGYNGQSVSHLRTIGVNLSKLAADDYAFAAVAAVDQLVRGGFDVVGRAGVLQYVRALNPNFRNRQAAAAMVEAMNLAKDPFTRSAISWLADQVENMQRAMLEAKKDLDKAAKLELLLTKFPGIFTSDDIPILIEIANTQPLVAKGLSKFILYRHDELERKNIPPLLNLAKTHSGITLALAVLAFARPELFLAEDYCVLLAIAKRHPLILAPKWILSVIKFPAIMARLMSSNKDYSVLGASWTIFILAVKRPELFQRNWMIHLSTASHRNQILDHAVAALWKARPELRFA